MKKFLVREVNGYTNRDMVLLKPMTLKEYITYVNEKIIEKVENAKHCQNTAEQFKQLERNFQFTLLGKSALAYLTFQYYPIPINENYKGNNRWISYKNFNKNLDKYKI